jgi:hypothetical protein
LDMRALRCTRADGESLQLSTVNKEAEQIVKIKKQAIAIPTATAAAALLAHFDSAGRQCSRMAQRDPVSSAARDGRRGEGVAAEPSA